MAGKRMSLAADMPLFAMRPMQAQTIINWLPVFGDISVLESKISKALDKWLDTNEVYIDAPTPRVLSGIAEELAALKLDQRIRYNYLPTQSQVSVSTMRETEYLTMTASQVSPDAIFMLLLATYRTFVLQRSGLITGLSWNITVAGACVTASAIGIELNHDA